MIFEITTIIFLMFFGYSFTLVTLVLGRYETFITGLSVYLLSVLVRKFFHHRIHGLKEAVFFPYAFFLAPFIVRALGSIVPSFSGLYIEDDIYSLESGMIFYTFLVLVTLTLFKKIFSYAGLSDRQRGWIMFIYIMFLSVSHGYVRDFFISAPYLIFFLGASPVFYAASRIFGLGHNEVLDSWVAASLPVKSVRKKHP